MTALPQSTRWFFSNQVVRLTNYDVVSMRVGVSQGLVAMPVRMRNLGQLLRRVLVLVVLVVFVDMRMFERLQRWAHRALVRRSRAVVASDATRARALADLVPEATDVRVIPIGAMPIPRIVE